MTCWASQFGWMGITNASQWQSAIVVYLLGYISYGVTLVFYASIFPRLARNTQKTKDARAKLDSGEIDTETYETTEMLERNRLSTISTAHSNCTSILPIFHCLFCSSDTPLSLFSSPLCLFGCHCPHSLRPAGQQTDDQGVISSLWRSIFRF